MIGLALVLALSAAPRLPYGDEINAECAAGPIDVDPAHATSIAELALASALFEGLYAYDERGEVVPVLARELPVEQDGRLIIPLRTGVVLHDGRALGPALVERAIARWASARSGAADLVLPIAGVRRRLAGDSSAPVGVRALEAEHAVELSLEHPFPDLPRFWASPRAAVAVAASGRESGWVGTGPFRLDRGRTPDGGVNISAFLGYREGRPFLERVHFRPARGPFAERRAKESAELLLDVPADAAPSAAGRPPRELWFLAVGKRRPELRSAVLFRAIDSALGRERLAKRYLSGEAVPVRTLTGLDDAPELTLPPRRPEELRATLLVPDRLTGERRFAERIQLDLLRAGITVVLETLSPAAIAERRKSGDFELMLDRALLEGGPRADSAQELEALLSMAGSLGILPEVVGRDELARIETADEPERRRRVAVLDRRLRDEAWIVPLVERTPLAIAWNTLIGAQRLPSGAVRLDDAYPARPGELPGGER
ncbi:MAG: ABC transporter substrate-binding protein [Myxococcota bacterium]